ncbi:hypothetical protein NC652_030059 [Populus alba x Populus x berolinensis]|nr:hypothetical protein NC652_030059 [Populus alba x Populus x berolinensis]
MQSNLCCFTLFLLFLIVGGSFARNIGGASNKMVIDDKKFPSPEMPTVPIGQTSPPSGASGSGHGPNWDYNWGWGSTPNGGWGYGSGSGRSPTGFGKGFGYGSGSGSGSGSGYGYGTGSGGAQGGGYGAGSGSGNSAGGGSGGGSGGPSRFGNSTGGGSSGGPSSYGTQSPSDPDREPTMGEGVGLESMCENVILDNKVSCFTLLIYSVCMVWELYIFDIACSLSESATYFYH